MKRVLLAAAMLCAAVAFGDEIDTKHQKLLYPVVRVRTNSATGSGTVIYSEDRAEKGTFRSYILTNDHVISGAVRVEERWDSLKGRSVRVEDNDLVDVELFTWSRDRIIDRRTVKAAIIAHDPQEDIAVLELRVTDRPYPVRIENVAHLISRDRLSNLRVFQPINVVGCSLGEDPLPSSGEITNLSRLIDGRSYMAGSAPIIFGNSGGAVFTAGDFDLIGMPARIAVRYGNPVPHMNYFVPAERIIAFAERQKLTFLVDPSATPESAFAEREKVREKDNK